MSKKIFQTATNGSLYRIGDDIQFLEFNAPQPLIGTAKLMLSLNLPEGIQSE